MNARTRRTAYDAVMPLLLAFVALTWMPDRTAAAQHRTVILAASSKSSPFVAQDDSSGEDDNVSADEVEKYVAVYKAMHKNRALSIEQAAAAQGMSVGEFRHLEDRVQRDDSALQHARDELQESAKKSSPAIAPRNERTPD